MSVGNTKSKEAVISVVIPCFNCIDTIERAVDSICRQTMQAAEVILVDDKSTDGTLERLRSLQKKFPDYWIKVIALERNSGPSGARNAGWDEAAGKYIALLDSDDIWHPRKLELQSAWMESHPDVVLTGHEISILGTGELSREAFDEQKFESSDLNGLVPSRFSKLRLLLRGNFSTSSVMVKREISNRFRFGKFYGEDRLLLLEIACSGGAIYKLPLELEGKFKETYGAGGLSGNIWLMEKGELDAFYQIWKGGHISFVTYFLVCIWSWTKYVRRFALTKFRTKCL